MQIRSTLETAEDIDPAVSVRSQSSIYRATRRVYASKSEFTTFARRVQFAFEIPTGVAPTFETSHGKFILRKMLTVVQHHWLLRLEFMVSFTPESDQGDGQGITPSTTNLLQLVEKDDRATAYLAVDTLYCEWFDCHVPVVVLPTNQEIPEDRVGLGGFVV
jgi:RAB6A-GEF complex partner protein 2